MNNMWYEGVMQALQEMEEITGPDLEEYIQTMEAIKEEVSNRLTCATALQCSEEDI